MMRVRRSPAHQTRSAVHPQPSHSHASGQRAAFATHDAHGHALNAHCLAGESAGTGRIA
ncbi:hypothetical protein BC831DRAFT_480425, partial [Entophlyctis helioformis]